MATPVARDASRRAVEQGEKEAPPLAMLLLLSPYLLLSSLGLSPSPFTAWKHRTLAELAIAIADDSGHRSQIAARRTFASSSSTSPSSLASREDLRRRESAEYREPFTAPHRWFRPLRPSPCLSDHTSGFRVSLRSPSTCPRSLPCCVSSPRSSSPVAVHRHRPPLPSS